MRVYLRACLYSRHCHTHCKGLMHWKAVMVYKQNLTLICCLALEENCACCIVGKLTCSLHLKNFQLGFQFNGSYWAFHITCHNPTDTLISPWMLGYIGEPEDLVSTLADKYKKHVQPSKYCACKESNREVYTNISVVSGSAMWMVIKSKYLSQRPSLHGDMPYNENRDALQ